MRTLVLTAALTLALAAPAAAQDAGLFGEATLATGFDDDPYQVTVTAGGPHSIDDLFEGATCSGWFTEQPTFVLNYTAGDEYPLDFLAYGDIDTVLIVEHPSGAAFCDDDSGLDGGDWVGAETPTSGRYLVWVGAYSQEATGPATLSITEVYLDEDFW